jgi:hypothetical protein
MNQETPMFVEFCSSIPTRVFVSSMFFTMGNREFLLGIWGQNPAILQTDIPDCWLRNKYSVRLDYEVGTSGSALKSHFISAVYGYLQTSLFISIFQTAVGIISPSAGLIIANEAWFSPLAKLWENRDLIGQPVITDIYLCVRIYASCLSYFSNRPFELSRNWTEM